VIKRFEVLPHGAREFLRFRPGRELAVDLAATAGISLDHTGVDGKAFAANQSCPHAPRHHLFEQAAKQSALAKAAVAVLGKGRMIWDRALEPQSTKMLMTVPGVGTVVALTYRTGIDDPGRFSRSRDVGAHFGLTPRRYSSGQTDSDAVAVADQQHPHHQLGID